MNDINRNAHLYIWSIQDSSYMQRYDMNGVDWNKAS